MYIIKNKPKAPKMIWDAEKGQPLLKFEGGCFQTEDEAIVKKAKALGYEVEEPKKATRKAVKSGE